MIDEHTTRINDYLDGELSDAEQRSFEAVLAQDAELAAEVAALRGVVSELGALPAEVPLPEDLWPSIQSRLELRRAPGRPNPRRVSLGWALAAGIAFASLVGTATWQLARSGGDAPPAIAAGLTEGAAAAASTARTVSLGATDPTSEPGYVDAVTGLLEVYENGRDLLDPETVQVLEESLATIDRAIAEAAAAMAEDPSSAEVRRMLQNSMTQKLNVLRQVAEAVQEQA